MPNPLSLVPIENLYIENREKIILAVGNVSRWKEKGFDNLLKIFLPISLTYPEWNSYIAGNGDPEYLKDLANKLSISDRVHFLGEIKDISPLLQKCSIYALTSRHEGMPMVLIEAMSQGLCCVAFDCFTGPRDILTNNHDGIIVLDQNINEFQANLTYIIENLNLRLNLGRNAIETSKLFLPEIIIPKWQNLIENKKN